VITLDTDTQLPRDGAAVRQRDSASGTARFDTAGRPEAATGGRRLWDTAAAREHQPACANRSWCPPAGATSIDPSRRLGRLPGRVPRGSFIGKDLASTRRAILTGFPDNRILSHDLVEGCYARSGLLSDVQLYEEYPSTYAADIKRRHRWIRGDWQLAGWLLPLVPGPGKRRLRNPLSVLSQWKLFDNLRRSLVPAD
jgi:hypothetical protein